MHWEVLPHDPYPSPRRRLRPVGRPGRRHRDGRRAAGGRHKVLDEPLIGLATPGTVVAGVTGAGHAWSIEEGNAKLFSDGRVLVNVEGLVLFPEGTQPAANVRVGRLVQRRRDAGNIVQSGPRAAVAARGRHALQPLADPAEPMRSPVIFVTSQNGSWFATTG